MSFATIQALEVVIAGSDNEKKVLRLNTLRDELETLESPPDLQPLLTSLKSSLDSSNGHLSYAALACLPPLARTLASPAHQSALKQLVFSLYSPASSSVASFLGDAKQRTRETARAALSGAASAACEAHVISQTSPRTDDVLQEIERIVKEQGLPVRLLGPGTECVTTVFSDPSLPASARGDLKNELAKQGTRRSTVDSILAKVFTTSNPPGNNTTAVGSGADDPPLTQTDNTVRDQAVDSSSNPLANSQTGPPGSEPPPPSGIINPVFVSGPRELESIFAKMLSPWEGKETEHNWQAREANMNTLRGMIKTNVHMQYTADFIAGLKSISEGLLKSLASLRTTMAVGACNAFVELSVLGPALDPLVDIILPPLLRMAAQTKKIVFQASQAAVTALIKSTYHPRVLQYLSACVNEKTVQARIAGVSRIKEFLDFHGQRSKSQIESGGGLGIIEKVLRRSPLIESLDGPTRKQLEKASTGRRAVSSASFKTEKEPSSRISVRSLIKSTRSAHRAAETPNAAKAAPISPRQVANSLGGIESPVIKSTGATSGSGLAHRTPERQNTAQSPRRNDLKRSVSARDPPTGDRSKSSISSPPLGLAITSTGKNFSPPKFSAISLDDRHLETLLDVTNCNQSEYSSQRLQSRKVLSAENIVEDAMKAQAEQAESAAHRLLELTEDENELQPLVPLGPGGVLLPATTRADHSRLTQLAQSNIPKQFQATTNKETMWKQFEDSPRNHLHIAVEEVPKKEIAHRGTQNLWWHRQAEYASPSDILKLIAQIEEHPPTSQDRQIYLDLSQACYEHRCSIGKVDSTGTIIKSEEKIPDGKEHGVLDGPEFV
ncbi:suppressor of tub2 mutation [Puccinia graminis f. sp. tritici]|uniref:Suppressor of tub2 mutation n=1 Tax=Puccinia graminis f. sp. tritici TaxID=56615 RepID=A0A5B0QDE6_PUCGR|nr:suppressor of tub2 mutation [Puccinia graminis f. sp. tritici]